MPAAATPARGPAGPGGGVEIVFNGARQRPNVPPDKAFTLACRLDVGRLRPGWSALMVRVTPIQESTPAPADDRTQSGPAHFPDITAIQERDPVPADDPGRPGPVHFPDMLVRSAHLTLSYWHLPS